MRYLQKEMRITPRDSHSVETYFHDIANKPTLTPDEEVYLAQRIHAGDEKALEQLVLGNLRFVITVAKHYLNRGLEFPDLISAGNIGLIKAARRFDETKGVKFCSYAIWWIRQSILQSIAKEGRAISLPANQLGMLSKISRETSRLEQQLWRSPISSEVSDSLMEQSVAGNISDKRIAHLLYAAEKPLSLDAPLKSEEDVSQIDILTDPSAPTTDDKLMKESLHDDIRTILSNLSRNESNILKMRYGIDHSHAYSVEEIALRMKMSHERIRQIHNKAIMRLQRNSTKEYLRVYL